MRRIRSVFFPFVFFFLSVSMADGSGYQVTTDLWIRAVINTVEKGAIDAVWKLGGEDTTSAGDRVIWGFFYASLSDVTWGSVNNPDLYVKIWFDHGGRVDVNFFHVSVPDIDVYSQYSLNGSSNQNSKTTMTNRYFRHEYNADPNNTVLGSASGTYTYDGNILTATFVDSTFPSGDGPYPGLVVRLQILSVSETSMTMLNLDDDDMDIWQREQGQAGNILGTWTKEDETDILVIGANMTFAYSEYIPIFTVPYGSITIDGNRTDWNSIEPLFTDAVNDEDPEADFEGTDLYKFYLARDDSFLYLMITLYDGDPNPNAQYALELKPNGGGGEGNYLAVARVQNGNWLSSVGVRDASYLSITYPIGYVGVGDHFLEWKVKLSDMQFLNDRYVFVYIHDFYPIFYPVSDYKATDIRAQLE